MQKGARRTVGVLSATNDVFLRLPFVAHPPNLHIRPFAALYSTLRIGNRRRGLCSRFPPAFEEHHEEPNRVWEAPPTFSFKGSIANDLTASASEPGLLRKHTRFESYETVSGFTYPRIRTFYKERREADKLPADLPLLVFIHGLGGSVAQFAPLLDSLVNVAPCLAIDLPGCGLSDFAPKEHEAYTTHALAEVTGAAIERFRVSESGQKVVLIGHSLGCSIAALLASSDSPLSLSIEDIVAGVVAMCPRAEPPTHQAQSAEKMSKLPISIIDAARWADRRGGINSVSVTRFLNKDDTDLETRKLQLKFNEQSQSEVFLRVLLGAVSEAGVPGEPVWAGIRSPVLLIAGASDPISPPSQSEKITRWLPTATLHTLPHPASHALPYTIPTLRLLTGTIESHLATTDLRLGRGWQLTHLTTSGKWDVKNLAKWTVTPACSPPIAFTFRAMKTLREVDPDHCPSAFAANFAYPACPDGVAAVIDLSHETPVYHPESLRKAGIDYIKFPTVSKEPPTRDEVRRFIALVDETHAALPSTEGKEGLHAPQVGVHCHYGYNRTGFVIACYMVEKLGWSVRGALAEFASRRAPGIKHEHFVNELYVRYAGR